MLPVTRFLIPKYLTDKEGDCTIEVFLLITICTLFSSFGLVFKPFSEVLDENLKPGGVISIAQDILKFQERL